MRKIVIIGLAGPAGVGKSTTAFNLHILAVNQPAAPGAAAMTIAFADPLYETAAVLTGRTVDQLKATKNQPWTVEDAPVPSLIGRWPRQLLQVLGTECIRNHFGQNFWVERLTAEVQSKAAMAVDRKLISEEGIFFVFVEDVRFENEAKACDLMIELSRDGVDYTAEHVSAQRLAETIPMMPWRLNTDGTLDDLMKVILTRVG